jgi:hypothetical protein
MLIHGARSVLLHLKSHPDQADGWLARVVTRRNPNIAAVALANKNARTVWALLAHGRDYQAGYRSAYRHQWWTDLCRARPTVTNAGELTTIC